MSLPHDHLTKKKESLLEELNRLPQPTAIENGLTFRPEDLGNSTSMRLRRLFRYRGAYIAHIGKRMSKRLLSKKEIRAKTFWGRELVLPNRDANVHLIRTSGTLGANENGLTRFLIRTLRTDDIFYDVGANYGFYTALAQELILTGEIHSFEPSSLVFAYLEKLASDRTVLNNVALSSKSGDMRFFDSYASHSSGKSTTSAEAAHNHLWDYTATTIQAVSLDDYCRTHPAPTLMKIDVEGAEADVLTGGRSTLEKAAPIVAVELWSGKNLYPFSQRTLDVFKELGYTPFFIEHSGGLRETTYAYLENWLKKERSDTNMIFKRRKTGKEV